MADTSKRDPFCTACGPPHAVMQKEPCEDCHRTYSEEEIRAEIAKFETVIEGMTSMGTAQIAVTPYRLKLWRGMLVQLRNQK